MNFLLRFLHHPIAGAVALIAATLLALLCANTGAYTLYSAALEHPLTLGIPSFGIEHSVAEWINDGLMAVFFLAVGLEIKREVREGELSSVAQAVLPVIGAIGGVVTPALIYAAFHSGTPYMRGWAIPTATDIAFSLGVLSLLGSRVPASLKIFLMAIAIMDDLIAVLVIALFYTAQIAMLPLAGVFASIAVLALLNRFKIRRTAPYLIIGLVMWLCMLISGVHATIAGVLLGLLMPVPLGKKLEHRLAPYITFGIVPLFAFANAGIPFDGLSPASLLAPLPLSLVLALFIGKQAGIFAFCASALKLKCAQLPQGMTFRQLHALSVVAGIGFTMSLFIGNLAFPTSAEEMHVRLGVMTGSLISALGGYACLRHALREGNR